MTQIFFSALGMLVIASAFLVPNPVLRAPAQASPATGPQLFLKPALLFDHECSVRTKMPIPAEWKEELRVQAPRFQAEWDRRASVLNRTAEKLAGRAFARKEFSVILTLCPWTPMGDPAFIVYMAPYLEASSRVKNSAAARMALFLAMTHHELLHSLVENIETFEFGGASATVKKYEKEPYNVLVHLHLMAIQKATYEETGDRDLLEAAEGLYVKIIGGDYARAWEIVKLEGTAPLLRELQKYNGKD